MAITGPRNTTPGYLHQVVHSVPRDHSPLLETHLHHLSDAAALGPVLDLACGLGRNGLYLLNNNIPTVFADRNPESLDIVQNRIVQLAPPQSANARLWEVDLETENSRPLAEQYFGAIIVFRYLHRPLLEEIKASVLPGGLVIYETFTQAQASIGRPRNPDYLLKDRELEHSFAGWQRLHCFEGMIPSAISGETQAIAQLVARKPDSEE